ncbi:MAG TPA: 2-phosphosulfolactate phosphatase [Rhodoglobus sp.]|nr:2-phosphosulfolactate phosphatase [Rhodoglobus sp.]
MTDPRNQSRYQVRFDWGVDGGAAIAPGAHILVWADALPGTADPLGIPHDGAVLTGGVGAAPAIARWILDRQVQLGGRAVVAVVAAGTDGRYAVEDLLVAGAVIDALAEVGIDFTSPEAAAAVGAYSGLRNAIGHVLSASVSGQIAGADAVAAARQANLSADVIVLRESSSAA